MEEQKLLEKIWGKVQKIDGLKKDIADLKEETGTMKRDITDLKEETGNLKIDINELRNETSDLKKDIKDLKNETGTMKRDITDLKEETGNLKIDITDLRSETGSLKKDIADLKNGQKEIKKIMKSEFKQIHQAIDDLNKTQNDLIDKVELIFTEIDYNREHIKRIEKEVDIRGIVRENSLNNEDYQEYRRDLHEKS
ncbi:MAG: hypothetical protein ACOCV3_05685 [Halanaerobiales bacterium]